MMLTFYGFAVFCVENLLQATILVFPAQKMQMLLAAFENC